MLAEVSTDHYTRLERGNLTGVSETARSASVRADPRCSTCSTCQPRRVTIWPATASEAVQTLRTNRETTPEGFHARILSDHFNAPPATTTQVSGTNLRIDLEDGASQASGSTPDTNPVRMRVTVRLL